VIQPPQPCCASGPATFAVGSGEHPNRQFLNWQDLELLLGTVGAYPPRSVSSKVGRTEPRWRPCSDSYARACPPAVIVFRSHTEHYTGQQNRAQRVVSGHSSSGTKAMHSDLSTPDRAEPIYFEKTDNFEDLRQQLFRRSWPLPKIHRWRRSGDYGGCGSGIFGASVRESASRSLLHLTPGRRLCRPKLGPQSGPGKLVIERSRQRVG